MSEPKRHHWWPEVQSRQWAGSDGNLQVVRADGSVFKAPPSKVGVEGELYTRLDPSGTKDREIEKWFSAQIETPFAGALARLLTLDGIVRSRPMGRGPDSARRDVEDLGFIIKAYDEHLPMAADDRQALVNYLAALVVRSPVYLAKLTNWHAANNGDTQVLTERSSTIRRFALENMLYLYDVYREAIGNAYITLTIADCDREFPDEFGAGDTGR